MVTVMKQIRRKKTTLCSCFNHKSIGPISYIILLCQISVIRMATTTLRISEILLEVEAVVNVHLMRFKNKFSQITSDIKPMYLRLLSSLLLCLYMNTNISLFAMLNGFSLSLNLFSTHSCNGLKYKIPN